MAEEEEVKAVKPGVVKLPYRWSIGEAGLKFFQGMKNKKIMGTKCPKCGKVLVPGRKFCPTCFVDLSDWVEVSDKGTLESWTLVRYPFLEQPKEPPYIIARIKLDGADSSFYHYLGGVDLADPDKVKDQIKIGAKVEAVWRGKTVGEITDIEYFKLA
ncbi:MAG: Zn-ribbon domain-containing OB-fold protein [Candidatus Freyarchaeota archaeon]